MKWWEYVAIAVIALLGIWALNRLGLDIFEEVNLW